MNMDGDTLWGMHVMLHGQSWGWWVAYFAANWIISIAYFAIPIRMALQRRAGLREAESVLFEMFVSACGLHHLVMPLCMLFGWMDPAMTTDWFTAAISVVSAIVIARPPPKLTAPVVS